MLNEANLKGVNFTGADLGYACLNSADLSRVNFMNANLEGANLTDAVLEGAKNLPENYEDVVRLDKKTD